MYNNFTIYTDYKSLTQILNIKDPNSRIIRWQKFLQKFIYDVQYTPGKDNILADALCSNFNQYIVNTAQEQKTNITLGEKDKTNIIKNSTPRTWTFRNASNIHLFS